MNTDYRVKDDGGNFEPVYGHSVPIARLHDPVNCPSHYTSHPNGIECIDVIEHMPTCVGNAIKYLWRAGLKDDLIQDLEKAEYYIKREIKRQLILREIKRMREEREKHEHDKRTV